MKLKGSKRFRMITNPSAQARDRRILEAAIAQLPQKLIEITMLSENEEFEQAKRICES